MGVDIGTYRSRIGTFRHGSGHDVFLLKMCLNYTGSMQVVGVVAFIGILLLMAGIESNPGPPTIDLEPIDVRKQQHFDSLLRRLNLVNWFPGKISFADVTTVDDDQPITVERLPWQMLKAILMSDSDARDMIVREAFSVEDDICPLDVFLLLFNCCDAMLKQKMYKALLMAKIAVPFLYIDANVNCYTLPIWSIRSLVIEWGDTKGNTLDNFIYDHKTAIVSFARIGRAPFSKSKLLNNLLLDSKHNTFYNKDSPLGTNNRVLCKNYVETMWYLPAKNSFDLYGKVVTFLNIRGDLNDYSRPVTTFLTTLTNIVIICVDVAMQEMSFTDMFVDCNKIIVVILTNKMKVEEAMTQQQIERLKQKLNHVEVIKTSQNGIKKSASDIQLQVQQKIKSLLHNISLKTLNEAFTCAAQFNIQSDEEDIECISGREMAQNMMLEIKQHKPQSNWKKLITPLHYTFAHQLKNLNRDKRRSCDSVNEAPKIKQTISQIKVSQVGLISKSMTCFIQMLISNFQNKKKLLYFIEWLYLLLETKSRRIMPIIRANYNSMWDELKLLKSKRAPEQDIEKQAASVKKAENEIEEASFGLEHLFREIAHIFDALTEVNKTQQTVKSLEPALISKAVATLITYGYTFELVDGDSSYIVVNWVKSVLRDVECFTNAKKVLTLSVLGVQSSGKSTLLNTMFGLKFAVSAGRCTRGVNVQLLPAPKSVKSFDHIMIVDSEGLRAPELRDEHINHDNELATLIIGLGSLTLLNVKGENTNEVHDILQIVIHAFMRIRQANRKLDTSQRCVFIHQNVSPMSSDKMRYSLQKLVEQLDNMTSEAANSERISGVTAFNQVIAFNENEHVFHIPDLWKGDPPMAANIGYVNAVADLRTRILQSIELENAPSFKGLDNISDQINDLWESILSEDFVFSFKNSMEIKASILMDETYKTLSWKLEKRIRFFLKKESENAFSKHDSEIAVDKEFVVLKTKLNNEIDKKYREIRLEMDAFFKHNHYTEIIINWKENRLNRFKEFVSDLESEIIERIKLLRNNRKVTIKMNESQNEFDSKIYIASINLAQELRKGRVSSEKEITRRFEEMWAHLIHGLEHSEPEEISFREIFIKRLREHVFSVDHHILYETISEYAVEYESKIIGSLSGSFRHMTIVETDLDISTDSKWKHFKGLVQGQTKAIMAVENNTEEFFRVIDTVIKHNCHEDNCLDARHVNELLHQVETWLCNLKIEKHPFTIRTSKVFDAKLCLFISIYADKEFQQHNLKFRKETKINSDAKLDKCKKQMNERFRGYLANRSTEMTAAVAFKNGI